jgi:hypothetical protein
VRHVNGVGVAVDGTGLGVKVAEGLAVEVGGISVWVDTISFGVEQAESRMRSGMQVMMIIA